MSSEDTRVKNPTPEDAIEQGRKDAFANAGKAHKPDTATEDAVAEGQDTARENIKADKANGFDPEGRTEHPLENDTSKTAKVETSQSQLDPTGNDPISKAEVTRAAVDGENVHGGTSVSNEDAADRAVEDSKPEDVVEDESEDTTTSDEDTTTTEDEE